jgi:hypothetical protein
MQTPRPNIVLHSHDTGSHVQPYGHQVPTPNIQRLADQGLLFRQAFAAAPVCSGSRAALLTGEYSGIATPEWVRGRSLLPLVRREDEELCDLVFDPNEAADLAGEDAYSGVVAELRERLATWMAETGDPLLWGPVEPRDGTELNLPEQRSATDPTIVVQPR